jgi:hypothetical protein
MNVLVGLEYLIHEVVGVLMAAGHVVDDAVNPALIAENELVEGGRIPFLGLPDKVLI